MLYRNSFKELPNRNLITQTASKTSWLYSFVLLSQLDFEHQTNLNETETACISDAKRFNYDR